MNCLNENNKEAKIYDKDNESCEGLEQDEISVWGNWGRVPRGISLETDIKGLLLVSVVGGIVYLRN